MKMLENLVKDLDQEDRIQLAGILKKSINNDEMEKLKTQLEEAGNDVAQRIAIKSRMNKIING